MPTRTSFLFGLVQYAVRTAHFVSYKNGRADARACLRGESLRCAVEAFFRMGILKLTSTARSISRMRLPSIASPYGTAVRQNKRWTVRQAVDAGSHLQGVQQAHAVWQRTVRMSQRMHARHARPGQPWHASVHVASIVTTCTIYCPRLPACTLSMGRESATVRTACSRGVLLHQEHGTVLRCCAPAPSCVSFYTPHPQRLEHKGVVHGCMPFLA